MNTQAILEWVKQQSFSKFAEEYIVNVDELEKFLTAQEGESEPMCVNCQNAGQFQAFCRIEGGNVSRSWVCNKHEPIPASPKEGK